MESVSKVICGSFDVRRDLRNYTQPKAFHQELMEKLDQVFPVKRFCCGQPAIFENGLPTLYGHPPVYREYQKLERDLHHRAPQPNLDRCPET